MDIFWDQSLGFDTKKEEMSYNTKDDQIALCFELGSLVPLF